MGRAIVLAARPGSTPPNPWVGCVSSPGRLAPRRHPVGGPHAEAGRSQPAGDAARGRHAVVTLEPALTTDAHRRAPTPSCGRGSRGCVASRTPTQREAARPAAPQAAGVEVEVGLPPRRPHQLAPYLKHRRTGRRSSSSSWRRRSTAAPRRPTAAASGSPARGPGRRPPPPGRERRRRGRRRHRAGRRSRADRPPRRGATRCAVVLGEAPAGAGPPRASSSAATWATCSTSSVGRGVLQACWSRAARPWPARSTAPASSTATCSTWPRRSSGATTPGPVRRRRRRHHRRRVARAASVGRAAGRRPPIDLDPKETA